MFSVLLLAILVPWSMSGPPTDRQFALKRDNEEPPTSENNPKRHKISGDSLTLERKSEEPTKCIYEGGRRTVPGKITRPSVSEVSETCSGDFTELSMLTTQKEFLGTKNELQLIRVRGSASFTTDFTSTETISESSGQFICDGHRKELSTRWTDLQYSHFIHSNGNTKCSYPDEYHKKRPTVRCLNSPSCSVTFEEASAVMTLERILLPVALPVCEYHKRKLSESVNTVALSEILPDSFTLRSGTQLEPAYDSVPPSSESAVSAETVRTFRAFAAAAGESRLTGSIPFSKMEKRTADKKVCGTRRLIDVMCKVVAKDERGEFCERVLAPAASVFMTKRTKHRYSDLMAIVSDRFYKSIGRREKLLSLALIAKAVPIRELREFIPGLSERMYYEAQRICLASIKLDQEKFFRMRFNPAKLFYYIDFITSPLISTDAAFGEKTVVATDGTKYTIPNTLRIQRASEIVDLYITSMTKRNLADMLFSKSTLFKILKYCAATERKASTCADYYFSDSELAFNDLNALANFLNEKLAVSKQWKHQKELEIKEYRFYLRGDYRMHAKNHSRVADHCFTYALSDPNNGKLRKTCNNQIPGESHVHDLKCDRCELGKRMMREMWEVLEEFASEINNKAVIDVRLKEDIEDWNAKLQLAQERIEEYKKHQLRSSISRKVHEWMVEETDEETASIIMDFSQKFLPTKHLESQSDYFGKKGMSSHVTHVTTKKNGRFAQHQIIHIIENDQQDSVSVIQLIRHAFEQLKKVGITSVSMRSDNAGAYHSALTVAAVYKLGKDTGMKLRLYGFSEPQDGKSGADRASGQFKNKVRAYVNAGGDANTHKSFFTAATSGRLMEGTSIYLVRVAKMDKPPAVKMDKISGYYDLQYEEKGIRAWRHKDIGEGVFFPASSFEKSVSSLPSLTVLASGGHTPELHPDGVGFWRFSPLANDAKTCPKDDIKSLLEVCEKKAFHCPDISCSASFDSEEELEVHWIGGVHCPSPMTMTLRDETLRMFSAGIEKTVSQRLNIPDVDEALEELSQSESDGEENVEEGWALKKRKEVIRFTEKAKTFIENIFDEGIAVKNKVPPEEAEKRMANARENGVRVFSVEERLNARQIASLYSRIAAFREQAGPSTSRRTKRFADLKIKDEDFDENSIFDEPWYFDDHDLKVTSIWENRHEIWDFGKEVEVDDDEIFKKNDGKGAGRHKRQHPTHLMDYLL